MGICLNQFTLKLPPLMMPDKIDFTPGGTVQFGERALFAITQTSSIIHALTYNIYNNINFFHHLIKRLILKFKIVALFGGI